MPKNTIIRLGSFSSFSGSISGLDFPLNFTSNSAARIILSGANLLPRVGHTAIWKRKLGYQLGYYSCVWHTNEFNLWDDHEGGHTYDFGTHPWPGDGTFDVNGHGQNGGGSGGTTQFHEIAGGVGGFGAADYIRDDTNVSLSAETGTWITSARQSRLITVSTSNDTIEHLYWPDISRETHFLMRRLPVSSLITPSLMPIFCFGASPWRDGLGGAGATSTDESFGGVLRGIRLFSTGYMSISDIQKEGNGYYNYPETSIGTENLFFINMNPVPSDIRDKSGTGRHFAWGNNAARPNLYTE
jgi:hypothetical protein